MRIYLAWASSDPVGWEPLEVTKSQDIRSLPDGGVPTRAFDPAIDGTQRLWLAAVNVQGVSILGFDHYGPSIDPTGRILVHAWNDDPSDWPDPWGVTWSFGNPRLDPSVGNVMNTDQLLTCWETNPGQAGYPLDASTTGGPVTFRPWSEFTEPGPANLVRHGIWITDPVLWELHLVRMTQTSPSWREYITP